MQANESFKVLHQYFHLWKNPKLLPYFRFCSVYKELHEIFSSHKIFPILSKQIWNFLKYKN